MLGIFCSEVSMSIKENIETILKKIENAKQKHPDKVEKITLVAVTKFQEVSALREVYQSGLSIFGENRVQELLTKVEPLEDLDLKWHIIGHLQTNKVRQIIDFVEMVHSLDRLSLAEELEKRASQKDRVLEVLLQVNIADEAQKHGMSKDEVYPFIEEMKRFSHLRVKGLMLIAPNLEDKEALRPIFKEMYSLFKGIQEKNYSHIEMDYLSMGMSGDYEIAIEEGSNMVRIGSAIFN